MSSTVSAVVGDAASSGGLAAVAVTSSNPPAAEPEGRAGACANGSSSANNSQPDPTASVSAADAAASPAMPPPTPSTSPDFRQKRGSSSLLKLMRSLNDEVASCARPSLTSAASTGAMISDLDADATPRAAIATVDNSPTTSFTKRPPMRRSVSAEDVDGVRDSYGHPIIAAVQQVRAEHAAKAAPRAAVPAVKPSGRRLLKQVTLGSMKNLQSDSFSPPPQRRTDHGDYRRGSPEGGSSPSLAALFRKGTIRWDSADDDGNFNKPMSFSSLVQEAAEKASRAMSNVVETSQKKVKSRMETLAEAEDIKKPPSLSKVIQGRIKRILRNTEMLFGVISLLYLSLVVTDM